MDELVQKPALFPQYSVPYLKLNINHKYQVMNYHVLQMTLTHVLKIPGVGLISGAAWEKDQFLSLLLLGRLLWDWLLSQMAAKASLRLIGSDWVICPLQTNHCGLGNGWTDGWGLAPSLAPQPPNLSWKWRSGGSPKGNLGIIIGSRANGWMNIWEPKATTVTNFCCTCCDIWEDRLQADPPGQNLAVERKEQEDPIRDCFLYNVGQWH